MSSYQLSPFYLGQKKAHAYHGLGASAIARILVKPDGKTHWSAQAVQDAIDKLAEKPKWAGERKVGSGAQALGGTERHLQSSVSFSVMYLVVLKCCLLSKVCFVSLFFCGQPS